MKFIDETKTNATNQLLLERFSQEVLEDYIGLWEIVSEIRITFGIADLAGNELQLAVTMFVQEMLRYGFVAVDLTAGGGCTPWVDQRPEEVVARIKQGWNDLGREPTIGELAWFNR